MKLNHHNTNKQNYVYQLTLLQSVYTSPLILLSLIFLLKFYIESAVFMTSYIFLFQS